MTYLSQATKDKKTPDETRPAPNIAAIDFGTSSVSLAYCINKGDVQTLKIDSGDFGRVPNAILIKKPEGDETEYKTNAFGQRAHSKYRDLHKNDRVKYVYFERVKVLLKRDDSHVRHKYIYYTVQYIVCPLRITHSNATIINGCM
jgi:molecular chaperone DnaK (HSP70)